MKDKLYDELLSEIDILRKKIKAVAKSAATKSENVRIIGIGGAKDDDTNVNISDVELEAGKVYAIALLLQDTPEHVNAIALDPYKCETIVTKGITVDANHCGVFILFKAKGSSIGFTNFPELASGKHGFVVYSMPYKAEELPTSADDYSYYAFKDGQSGFKEGLYNKDVVVGFCVDGANYDHSILEASNQSEQAFNAYLIASIKAVSNSDVTDHCKYVYMKLTQSYAQGAFVGFNLVRG